MEILRRRLKIAGWSSVPLEVATETRIVRVGYALKCDRCTHVLCFSREETSAHQNELHSGDWPRFDGTDCMFRGRAIHLIGHKARILKLLVDAEGRLVSQSDLTSDNWSHRSDLQVLICRLRRDIEPYGLKIKAVRFKGYYLDISASSEQT